MNSHTAYHPTFDISHSSFSVPDTLPAWLEQRRTVRYQLGKLLGSIPPRPGQLHVEVISREDRGGYVLEKIRFDNGAGEWVHGWLFLPPGAGKDYAAPAILYCHWHGGQYDIGKDELLRTNAVPVPPGPTLAREGFVVLGIDAPCFGERNGTGTGERDAAGELSAAKLHLWAGRSLWSMILRDDLIALDYLTTRPEVNPSRIGVTGISMGATRAWWLMALDDRLCAGAAVGCMTRYRDLIEARQLHAHGIYYYVPGVLEHFDTEAIVACIAPRPVLFQTGENDPGSPISGVREIERLARPAWSLHAADEHLQNITYPRTGHTYTSEMWTRTKAWLGQHLRQDLFR